MKIDLSKYENPKIIQKDGKLQIYDKLKGIYRVVSPDQRSEEYVRQKIIEYLNHELNINYQAIDIEESEAHYHENNQRMDLLISGMSDKKELLMVVECKAETVELTEDVYIQAKGYAERLNIPVIMVTNGLEADFLKKDENNSYEQIIKPPTYEELLDYPNIKTKPIPEYSYNRYSYEELFDEQIQKQEIYKKDEDKTKAIHSLSKKNLIPHILNLRDCLLDTSHKIQDLDLGKYEFVKDLGVFYRKVDNTGGKFVGNYRSLLVKINNNPEIIDLKITPYFTESGGTDTAMMIALNGAEIQWIHFDRFGVLEGEILNFYDDGTASTRNKGQIKRSIILDFIKENSNLIINKDNMIELGQINMNNLIYADNLEFENFLGNCIKYALLKQEKREEYQQNYVTKSKSDRQLSIGIQKNHINKIIKKINVKQLSDESMNMLINHLNDTSIILMENASKEAEKVHHRSISPYDFARSLYRPSKINEKVTILGDEFNSILDYMKEGIFTTNIENVLWDNDLKQYASEHEYEGIYTFVLEYPSSKQVLYYFVFIDIFEEYGDEIIELVPIYLPDVELFKYFDNENKERLYADLNVFYEPYSDTKYQTKENELVDFYANIRPINDNDLYVTEKGINYLVNTKETFPIVITKEELDEMDLLDEMESDNFKGLYCEQYVYNTGEYVVEDYTIKKTDDNNVYFEDNTDLKRNCNRIPQYILYDDENNGYLMVKNYICSKYISIKELENLDL